MGIRIGFDSRRTFRLLVPRAQLMLTGGVILISAGFAALFAWHVDAAYSDVYAMVASTAPQSFLDQAAEQEENFVLVSAAIVAAYVGAVVIFCVSFSHRMLGPIVPLRRQIEALKNGDTASLVTLRDYDSSFQPIADDLNELSRMIARDKLRSRS